MISITDAEFKKLTNYIKKNYGIYIKREKSSLLTGRLNNVLKKGGFSSFSDYYEYIISDNTGRALVTLIDKITTNHTFFMREAEHFFYFRQEVLPYLSRNVADNDLRIWSAGCSTGEEPYTLAMILYDYFKKEKLWWDTKVLATDISQRVLDTAKKGIYNNQGVAVLPPAWQQNYFNKIDNEKSVLTDNIKNEVIFRRFNLMEEVFPFKRKFHVIFCRNVMIYFDGKTKDRLLNKFYNSMERGGHLFIGHSESLGCNTTKFKYVMPSVYKKE